VIAFKKLDYQGKVKKTLTHVFVAEVNRPVKLKGLRWYREDSEKKR
jgi:hypothetical protein